MIPLSEATNDVPKPMTTEMDIETESDTEDAKEDAKEDVKEVKDAKKKMKDNKRKRNEPNGGKSKRHKVASDEGARPKTGKEADGKQSETKEKISRMTVVALCSTPPPKYATKPTRVFSFCAGAGCEERDATWSVSRFLTEVPFPAELKVFKNSLKVVETVKALLEQGHTARAFDKHSSYRRGRKELILAIGRTPTDDAAHVPVFKQQQAEKKEKQQREEAHQERLWKIRALAGHRGADNQLDADVDAIEKLMTPAQVQYWHRELLMKKRELLENVVRHLDFERAL